MPIDYLIPTAITAASALTYILVAWRTFPQISTICIALAIAAISHIPGLFQSYYGSEYEDAYVFQADSKDLADHNSEVDPFRVQVQNYDMHSGSGELFSYNGHFTAYSGIVALANSTFGYSPKSTIYFNFIFTLLMIIVILDIIQSQTSSKFFSLLAILFFCSSAAINVFHTSGLSETYSSLNLAIVMAICSRISKRENSHNLALGVALVLAIASSLVIKRENMTILAIVPFLYLFLEKRTLAFLALPSGLLFVAYLAFVQPFSTEFLESNFIAAPTFSANYLISQLPVYILTLLDPTLFGISFASFIVSLVVMTFFRVRPSIYNTLAAVLFFAFLFTYCIHYRSQFFIQSLEIGPFETFRYLNNFYFLLVVTAVLNLKAIEDTISRKSSARKIAFVGMSGVYLFGLINTSSLRFTLNEEEQAMKILPAMEILDSLSISAQSGANPTLVTDIPLVFLMFTEIDSPIRISEYESNAMYRLVDIAPNTYFYFSNEEIFEMNPHRCNLRSAEGYAEFLKRCGLF